MRHCRRILLPLVALLSAAAGLPYSVDAETVWAKRHWGSFGDTLLNRIARPASSTMKCITWGREEAGPVRTEARLLRGALERCRYP
jgi:hypothetical protein